MPPVREDATAKAKLLRLYRTPGEPGALRGIKGLQSISKANNLGPLTTKEAKAILEDDRAYTTHGRIVKGAKNLTERIVTSWPFDLWEADLMDAPHTREQARRDKYLLCVIDVFTKYAMVRVIEKKDGQTIGEALKDIISENVPHHARLNGLRTDAGKEFFNTYCTKNVYIPLGINHYRAQKEPGASVVERFIGTLARSMAKYVTTDPSKTQAELLALVPSFVDSYNRTIHSTIRQTPQSLQDHAYERGSRSGLEILEGVIDGSGKQSEEQDLADNKQTIAGLYQSTALGRNKLPNPWDPEDGERVDVPLSVGQHVRLLQRGDIFRKGTRAKSFGDEVFTVTRASRNNPNAYYIADEQGEEIKGKVYRRQLQTVTSKPERWEVRVLRRRTRRGVKELQVEWVGHPHLPPEWIPAADATEGGD